MTVLVDSDIVIEVLRGRNAGLLARWNQVMTSRDAILCSPVTAAELWAGVRPSETAVLGEFLDALTHVPIDHATGRKAGDYLRQFSKSHGLELGDALIAAASVLSGAALWTQNLKHYPMPDVTLFP